MVRGLLLLAGAPESKTLKWHQSGLLDDFSGPFLRFAGRDGSGGIPPMWETPSNPAWRSLPLERPHLTAGVSDSHGWPEQDGGAAFLSTTDLTGQADPFQRSLSTTQESSLKSEDRALSIFYEHSYGIHEDIVSSQIVASSDPTSARIDESSFFTDSSIGSPKEIPTAGHLTDLKDVPNAAYLNAIRPQTMTVNVIVGLISVPAARLIKTKRGADVELIEILVGDETKSGFGINFWLQASPRFEDDTGSILNGLRPQDIVLIRNVALSSFRGRVYGQSLRKDLTKTYLLYRNRIDKTDLGGCYRSADLVPGDDPTSQLAKTMRVREWVIKFVGGITERKCKSGTVEDDFETLPPDTQ